METVIRLLDMGLDPFNFADALLGIMAQRLVRRICEKCKEPYHPDRAEFDDLAASYGKEEFEKLGHRYDEKFTLFRGTGCAHCNKTGYRGRAGLHEVLAVDEDIRHLIYQKALSSKIRELAIARGLIMLKQDGIRKVIKGATDLAEVRSVCMK